MASMETYKLQLQYCLEEMNKEMPEFEIKEINDKFIAKMEIDGNEFISPELDTIKEVEYECAKLVLNYLQKIGTKIKLCLPKTTKQIQIIVDYENVRLNSFPTFDIKQYHVSFYVSKRNKLFKIPSYVELVKVQTNKKDGSKFNICIDIFEYISRGYDMYILLAKENFAKPIMEIIRNKFGVNIIYVRTLDELISYLEKIDK